MEFGITSFSQNIIVLKNKSPQISNDGKKYREKENEILLTPLNKHSN